MEIIVEEKEVLVNKYIKLVLRKSMTYLLPGRKSRCACPSLRGRGRVLTAWD